MSIVPLNKISIFGLVSEKEKVLEELQMLGCMHLIPHMERTDFRTEEGEVKVEDVKRAIDYLCEVTRLRRQEIDEPEKLTINELVGKILHNRKVLRDTEDIIYLLKQKLQQLEPWGNFELPDKEELGGYRLWFYRVPTGQLKKLEKIKTPWQIVGSDHRYEYVVLISKNEPHPSEVPVLRSRVGSRSLSLLERDLRKAELRREDCLAQRESLSRWLNVLTRTLLKVQDRKSRKIAGSQLREEDGVLCLEGWLPRFQTEEIEEFATKNNLAILVREPSSDDRPPTLMNNPEKLSAGEGLVTFYKTPDYYAWDPSIVVFFSFALFFAMILADAGYALVLFLVLGYFWKGMGESKKGKRARFLAFVILSISLVYGMLLGCYFGFNPPDDWIISKLKVLEVNDYNSMMLLSVVVGCLHLIIANVAVFLKSSSIADGLPSIGWIGVIASAFILFMSNQLDSAEVIRNASYIGMGTSFLMIIIFSGKTKVDSAKGLFIRAFEGLISLANVTKLFGDTMSYLRLFALGLASGSLAVTFNQIAGNVHQSIPGFGLFFGIMILFVGHLLNIALTVVSCFVHGLRLNMIEFFNWGLSEDGYPFQAFAKKESIR